MRVERCILCGRADRPFTREHVFARWLVIKLKAGKLVASDAAPAPERIGQVITTVCADCNAGWMSSLETSFRRVMFRGPRTGVLQEPDRITLSRWFAKTAILLAHARGALVDGPHRAQLVGGMPDDLEVFVARRRRPAQRLDHAVDADSVSIQIDDVVGHVARPGILTGRHGTRLWPLRSHLVRWETLPIAAAGEAWPKKASLTRPRPARVPPARRSGR